MRVRFVVTLVLCGVAVAIGCGVEPLDLNGKTCPCDDAAGYSCDTHTNKCVATSCDGKTCLDLGVQCGATDDTCGRYLQCGDCDAPGFECKGNTCECKSNTCAGLGALCGSIPDGCPGRDAHDCGGCPAGQTCGGGGDHKCGQNSCSPKTCAGTDCGQLLDGCGGVLTCKACCTPKTCTGLGWVCGSGPDGCGGTARCPGSCPVNEPVCTVEHKCCKPITCTTDFYHCGANVPDGCGGLLQCGGCDAGTCNETTHRC